MDTFVYYKKVDKNKMFVSWDGVPLKFLVPPGQTLNAKSFSKLYVGYDLKYEGFGKGSLIAKVVDNNNVRIPHVFLT